MIATAVDIAQRIPLPDLLTRTAIHLLVDRTDRSLRKVDGGEMTADFARAMSKFSIAEHTDAANAQHYEVPAGFFAHVLGPRMKYSSCFYEPGDTLADAESRSLQLTVEHAGLADGQQILELGCGWGSLSLYMAERYPAARITAVSNSASQRAHIESQASARGLSNLHIITADINGFDPESTFDRVVSVEMFEHVANWSALFSRVKTWLSHEGRLFLHVFSHETAPYRFDHANRADFIAQYFFTGGIMPSHALAAQFPQSFTVEESWRWSGEHYERTARDWLKNFDANRAEIRNVLVRVYGSEAPLWERRWRLFFLATAGLFGYRGGVPWGVSHYRLKPS